MTKYVKITATGFDDLLLGTDLTDKISDRGGNDIIFGGPGSDKLKGGAGNDSITGGAGVDTIGGGKGIDVLVYQDPLQQYALALSTHSNLSGTVTDFATGRDGQDTRQGRRISAVSRRRSNGSCFVEHSGRQRGALYCDRDAHRQRFEGPH